MNKVLLGLLLGTVLGAIDGGRESWRDSLVLDDAGDPRVGIRLHQVSDEVAPLTPGRRGDVPHRAPP